MIGIQVHWQEIAFYFNDKEMKQNKRRKNGTERRTFRF